MVSRQPCPHCGQRLKIEESRLGTSVRCPACGEKFVFEGGSATTSDKGASASASDSTGSIAVATSAEPEIAIARGTDVGIWLTGLIGLALTAVLYTVLELVVRSRGGDYGAYVVTLLTERGWVQYAIMAISFWALSMLAFKLFKVRKQKASLLYDLLPQEEAVDIRPDNVERFRVRIRSLPIKPASNLLLTRVLRALEHFESRRSRQEVASFLSAHAEIDAAAVESSYTMIKVFIWAVPILGFIGTVLGIGDAVSSFSQQINQTDDIQIIKVALNGVTTGLAVAFDTTLLALVMSIVLMFVTHWLQKLEDDLLNSIGNYCNMELLMRLEERDPSQPTEAERMQSAIQSAVSGLTGFLEDWRLRVAGLGATVSADVESGWRKVDELLTAREAERERHVDRLLHRASQAHGDALSSWIKALEGACSAAVESAAATWGELAGATQDELRRTTSAVCTTLSVASMAQGAGMQRAAQAYEDQARRLAELARESALVPPPRDGRVLDSAPNSPRDVVQPAPRPSTGSTTSAPF